jgi:ABC-type nitrate/sulfonate/bicarbonate transport system ATPase subunit
MGGKRINGKRGLASYMPQKDVLFPWRTVLDNVITPLEVGGVSKKAAREEAVSLLPVFGLAKFADSYPWALSGGMRQRAAFLRTYLNKQELMLLDEPFGQLDALTRIQMQQWLLEIWHKFRRSILFVTHDVEEAIMLSDRIYVMSARPGRIIAEEKIAFSRPRDLTVAHDPAFVAVKMRILGLLRNFTGNEVAAGV